MMIIIEDYISSMIHNKPRVQIRTSGIAMIRQ